MERNSVIPRTTLRQPVKATCVQLDQTKIIQDIRRGHQELDRRISDRITLMAQRLEIIYRLEEADKNLLIEMRDLGAEVESLEKRHGELMSRVVTLEENFQALSEKKVVLAGRVAKAREDLEKEGRA